MWSLIRGEPKVVIRWAAPLILGGLLLGFASAQLKFPGVITAVFAITLGAAGGSLIHWERERGLWMLAALFMLIYCVILGLFLFGRSRDLLRGAVQPDIGVVIDFSLGSLLLSSTIRFLWRVARYNWTFSRLSANELETEKFDVDG